MGVSKCTLHVVCCAPVAEGRHPPSCRAGSVQGRPGDGLPLSLVVLRKFSLGLGLCASEPWSGIDEAGT